MEPAGQTVMQIARGYQLSQALYVAAKLGVADVLAEQVHHVGQEDHANDRATRGHVPL